MTKWLAALGMLVASTAHADGVKEITWDDLVPEFPQLEEPLQDLNQLARDDLYVIHQIEGIVAESGGISPQTLQLLEEARANLETANVDIPASMQELVAFEQEIERRDQIMVDELDRQNVRLPGYALPLELSEEGVSEFLLVPYVGACIHTPPPPPNQTIMVELPEPYKIDSLYDAVWITGEIRVQQSTRSLSFVDGAADVSTGYHLAGILIEPYEW